MIQKLRHKFILINMLLVTAVLLIVFATLLYSTYSRMYNESVQSLTFTLERGTGQGGQLGFGAQLDPPKLEMGGKRQQNGFSHNPVFLVSVDESGTQQLVFSQNAQVSNDVVSEAMAHALKDDQDQGSLLSLQLRYMRKTTDTGTLYAFVDVSNDVAMLRNTLLTSLLIGLGGLGAFFLISMFLANWALRPVQRAWEQQRQFVADASHELKTPLTVILANLGILLSHKEDTIGQQQKWVENTREEAQRMKGLVEDMLFLAKSDATRDPIPHMPFNFSDTVWSCLLPFESVAFEKGVTLDSEVAPDLTLKGDSGQMKQLVSILLDNACKYAGSPGRVFLKLEGGEKITLSVQNTGDPIPPEDQEHIFERFYRADKARVHSEGGYGLGLAIAKTITESHRGRIEVQSDAEHGTTFTVTLPPAE